MDPVTRRHLLRVGLSTAGLAIVAGCGQQPLVVRPRVARAGLLWTGSELTTMLPSAWRDGLRDAGWVEGQK